MIGGQLVANFREASNPNSPWRCHLRTGRKRSVETEAGARPMRRPIVIGGLMVAAQILGIPGALAGPWEDGMAAYNRGDYLPAIRLFRPLAEKGNPCSG
jgi:hypothetical protein